MSLDPDPVTVAAAKFQAVLGLQSAVAQVNHAIEAYVAAYGKFPRLRGLRADLLIEDALKVEQALDFAPLEFVSGHG